MNRKANKLSLNSETVRILSGATLARVLGGQDANVSYIGTVGVRLPSTEQGPSDPDAVTIANSNAMPCSG